MEGFGSSSDLVRFAGFELDPQAENSAGQWNQDSATGATSTNPPDSSGTPGQIIAREELRQKIWPSDTFVDFDHGINNAIKRMRETLGIPRNAKLHRDPAAPRIPFQSSH